MFEKWGSLLHPGSDYVYFFYGLSFLFLGVVCFLVKKKKKEDDRFDWKGMGCFGIFYGFHEWLELAEMYQGWLWFLQVPSFLFAAVACVCLLEFCRRYLFPAAVSGVIAAYLFLTVFFFWGAMASGGTPVAFKMFAAYLMGLPAGVLTSFVFLRASREKGEKIVLRWLALFFFLYAVTSLFDIPRVPMALARFINDEIFRRLFGFSPEAMRGLLAFGIMATLLVYLQREVFPGIRHRWLNWKWLLLLEAVILVTGSIFTNRVGQDIGMRMGPIAVIFVVAIFVFLIFLFLQSVTYANIQLFRIQQDFLKAQHLAKVGNFGFDFATRRLQWSRETFLIHGLDAEEPEPSLAQYLRRVHPGDLAVLDRVFSTARRHDETAKIDYRLLRDDGTVRYVCLEGLFRAGSLYWPPGFFGTLQDITERKEQEEQLRAIAKEWESTFDAVPDLIFIQDTEFRIWRANKAFLETVKMPREAIVGKKCYELVHKTLHPWPSCPFTETQKDFKPHEVHVEDPNLGVPFLVSASPLFDHRNNLVGAVHVAKDISAIKKTEQDLRCAKEEAEANNKAKNIFLAKISHEIRTPMNAIMGFSELLRKTPLDDQQKEYLGTIIESGENLVNIITDILDISKIEAGHLILEESDFSLEYLLENLMKIVAHRLDTSRVAFSFEYDPGLPKYFRADPTRLRQVLLNILINAIKFTEQGKVIVKAVSGGSVDFRGEKRQRVSISIADTGIGIPGDKLNSLFKPFAQVDPSIHRRFGGTGLGLAIVKGIVEAMGGEISVDSDYGKGTCFTITLPLAVGRSLIEQEIALASMEDLKGKRVVIIDQDDYSRATLESYCKDFGLVVVDSGDAAQEALKWLDGGGALPDIVVVDVSVSARKGFGLPQALRENPRHQHIKTVAITSEALPNTLPLFQKAGFHAYLAKPFLKKDVLQVFLAMMGDKRTESKIITRHVAQELALKGLKVLVVEDNAVNMKLTRTLLARFGCVMDEATDGRAAVAKVKEQGYDVILMDLEMPFMNGIEATLVIRGELKKQTPIIGLSAAAMREDEEKARGCGMNDFLTKPIDVAKLKNALAVWGRKESGG